MKNLARLFAIALLAGACAELPTEPAAAPLETVATYGTWDAKVTGGSDLYAGSCGTLIIASVTATDQDGVRGQFQVKAVQGSGTVPDCAPLDPEVLIYQFHGEVDQLATAEGSGFRTASACGVISAAQGDGSAENINFQPGSYFRVDIRDHDSGADRLRHRVSTSEWDCSTANSSYPAASYAGGFTVRIR